jgi:hypothetical protein
MGSTSWNGTHLRELKEPMEQTVGYTVVQAAGPAWQPVEAEPTALLDRMTRTWCRTLPVLGGQRHWACWLR